MNRFAFSVPAVVAMFAAASVTFAPTARAAGADCAGTYTVVANGFRFNIVVQDAGGDNIVGFLVSTTEAATPISGTCAGHGIHFTRTSSSFTQIYDGGFWNGGMGGTFSHNGDAGYGWYGIRQ